jgi:hypothetical protein
MEEKCTFKVAQDTLPALRNLRRWCKMNRVPLGRLMNAFVRAAQNLPPHSVLVQTQRIVITIPLPKQVDLDDHLRYIKTKQTNVLTRVK